MEICPVGDASLLRIAAFYYANTHKMRSKQARARGF